MIRDLCSDWGASTVTHWSTLYEFTTHLIRLNPMASIIRFLKSEDGPTAVEYAVMLMLILTVCIGSIQVIADWLYGSMDTSSGEINNYLS